MKLLFPLLILVLSACAGQPNYSNRTINIADLDERPSQIIAEYKIGIGDTINITVWKNPDLSVTVPVRPDGMISAPLVGDMLVAGFTPEEVSTFVEIKLKEFIRTPNVVVIMTNLGSAQYFSGDHEEALTSIYRMRNPHNTTKRTRAIILARLGRLEESRMLGAEFLKGMPGYNFEEYLKGWHFKDDAYRVKLAEDLRKAGLSEKRL